MSCDICCESFTKAHRAPVECSNLGCTMTCCKECSRKYILTTQDDPHCMGCRHAWDQQTLVKNLNRSFVDNEYRKHRTHLLVDHEISKLPETMDIATNHKKAEELAIKDKQLDDEIRRLRYAINQCTVLRDKIRDEKIRLLKNTFTQAKNYKMACPNECRGYLSTEFKCEICDTYTCPDCLCVIGDQPTNPDHVCSPDAVETATLIMNTTKPCPSCGERIHKIDGCDQIWCTMCHTAFSWKTGAKETGSIHNPHFHQYRRDNGGVLPPPREIGDVFCGGVPHWRCWKTIEQGLLSHARSIGHADPAESVKPYHDTFLSITRLTGEMVRSLRASRTKSLQPDNTLERVDYILKRTTKEELAAKVYKKDIARRRHMDEVHIYELATTIGIDILRHLFSLSEPTFAYLDSLNLQYDNFRQYINILLAHHSIAYKIPTLTITIQSRLPPSRSYHGFPHYHIAHCKTLLKNMTSYDPTHHDT